MAFTSDLMGIPVIETPSDIPVGTGEPAGYEQRDRSVDAEGGFAKPYTGPVFSRREIIERAEERERTKQRTFDMLAQAGVGPMYQYRWNYCWGFAACDGMQVQRVRMGAPHIPLSAVSVCALVKNYSNVGGWPIQWLKKAASVGACPASFWPNDKSGSRYDTSESRAARDPFRVDPDGWLDLPANNWDVVFTRLVLGDPVTLCHMEWRHAVLAIDVVVRPGGKLAALCRNSGYGRDSSGHSIVAESFGLPDDALAVQGVTAG